MPSQALVSSTVKWEYENCWLPQGYWGDSHQGSKVPAHRQCPLHGGCHCRDRSVVCREVIASLQGQGDTQPLSRGGHLSPNAHSDVACWSQGAGLCAAAHARAHLGICSPLPAFISWMPLVLRPLHRKRSPKITHPPDTHWDSMTPKVVCTRATAAAPGNSLEMQTLGPHPRPTGSESAF